MSDTQGTSHEHATDIDRFVQAVQPAVVAGADRTRLRIMLLLASGLTTVRELYTTLEVAQSSVSHHIKYMKETGLITAEKDGRNIRYTLNENAVTVSPDLQSLVIHVEGGSIKLMLSADAPRRDHLDRTPQVEIKHHGIRPSVDRARPAGPASPASPPAG